ncbi:MAG: MerR family transcriptional regulator [Planctomycetota bacterium]|jgi:DNA-binding transcriptional MerR regulator
MHINDNNKTFQVPEKFYRIGELVHHTALSRQTIHNYTAMGLIREAQWTKGGHRLYDESVFGKLAQITRLKKNKTLLEIKKILNSEKAES